ncbi:Cytochrome P450 94A2-like protein [Drosera capensis]
MFEISPFSPFIILILSFLIILYITKLFSSSHKKLSSSTSPDDHGVHRLPKVYPIIGSTLAYLNQPKDFLRWITEIMQCSSCSSYVLHRPLGERQVFTISPANVEHMLKTNFPNYPKGKSATSNVGDFLRHGIFAVDGQEWKFQRQIASHEFNTKSLRNFVEHVVQTELSSRLIPILADAANNRTLLDFQDILKRFAFDNICRIAFGYDPEYLTPSLPHSRFAEAFEEATMISSKRSRSFFPPLWKLKRALDIGSEKQLRIAVSEVRQLARTIVTKKRTTDQTTDNNLDLLSRFLKSGHVDEDFVIDIVISFILAGRDTTSSALTWFFWLLSKNSDVESEILKEIAFLNSNDQDRSIYDSMKSMEYTHAALCESMRLYPPVPVDTKEAAGDDVLPDGTKVSKGMRVAYHVYAMGRCERIWGKDWMEFNPERWMTTVEENDDDGKINMRRKFVGKDAYTYPVFQAGPRICLGKEMAFLQMKRIVAGVLGRFRVVPMMESGVAPVYLQGLTATMKDGLPVRVEERSAKM